jgi:tRNA pseudouridine38-40 synthase
LRRVALGIEYDGTGFVGWQSQANGRAVQDILSAAVAQVAAEPAALTAAGRTDAGVHAEAQVVHFDTSARRTDRQWVLGINSHLPDDVAVTWARSVDSDFDAMSAAAVYLLGEQDFSALRAAGCQSRSAQRCVTAIRVAWRAPFVHIDVTANAFLYHMVRNMVGLLVRAGSGAADAAWVAAVLASGDRSQGAPTAPAQGLTLRAVVYPERFGVPAHSRIARDA